MVEAWELTLWQLGDRFGHVTPEGIVLRLALTHELPGELVAAQRPSVTTALRSLEARQRLRCPAPHECCCVEKRPRACEH